MKKFASLAALAAFALVPFAAQADTSAPHDGQIIFDAAGHKIAPAYHVNADGSVQIILDGTLVTLPAATLTSKDGKVVSSQSKADLMKAL
jgi:hypothetical protein